MYGRSREKNGKRRYKKGERIAFRYRFKERTCLQYDFLLQKVEKINAV
jgi:hypothetical protein